MQYKHTEDDVRYVLKTRTYRNPETGCREWLGNKNERGYGIYTFNGIPLLYRSSFLLHYGYMPVGLLILHRCNNTSCVNPEHLYAGTYKDNMQDLINSKGHPNTLKTHCPKGHEYTEQNTRIDTKGARICKECNRIRGSINRAIERTNYGKGIK